MEVKLGDIIWAFISRDGDEYEAAVKVNHLKASRPQVRVRIPERDGKCERDWWIYADHTLPKDECHSYGKILCKNAARFKDDKDET